VGVQVHLDWARFGLCPLGDDFLGFHGLVTILGCSRAPQQRQKRDGSWLREFGSMTGAKFWVHTVSTTVGPR